MHWRSMMPARSSRANHMTGAQRWSYLSGALQWYGDLLGPLFLIFLLAGAFNLATGGGQLFRKLTVFLVAAVPVLVVLGLVRAIALLRRGTGASTRDALGAFFIWQSTSLVVARASVLALFALAALLLFPTLGMGAAPVNSWAARRAALPAWLRERRRTEYRRDRRTFATGAATGGAIAVLGVAVAAVVLLVIGHQANSPDPVGPARGPATTTGSPTAPGSTTSPTTAPTTAPPTSASASTAPATTGAPATGATQGTGR